MKPTDQSAQRFARNLLPLAFGMLVGCVADVPPPAPTTAPSTAAEPPRDQPAAKTDGKPDTKPTLSNSVTIEEKDGVRTITSNGIPDHKPGKFPNRGNPNTINAQKLVFRMTMTPKVTDTMTPHRMH